MTAAAERGTTTVSQRAVRGVAEREMDPQRQGAADDGGGDGGGDGGTGPGRGGYGGHVGPAGRVHGDGPLGDGGGGSLGDGKGVCCPHVALSGSRW